MVCRWEARPSSLYRQPVSTPQEELGNKTADMRAAAGKGLRTPLPALTGTTPTSPYGGPVTPGCLRGSEQHELDASVF